MYWDDDGAGGLHSKIVPPSGGTGAVILGSYSRYTEGQCLLGLVGQSYKAPWMSPAPWASVAEPSPPYTCSRKYMEELERQKPALDELSPDTRDQRVLELQRTMLSEEEIRRQHPRMPAVSTDSFAAKRTSRNTTASWRRSLERCHTTSGQRNSRT